MEVIQRLKIPAASVHDTRYLYAIVAGLKRREGRLEDSDKTLEYFRRLINDYNQSKATNFGLSAKPSEVNVDLVKDAVTELVALGTINRDGGRLVLTSLGEEVAKLIERRERDNLRRLFAKAMLDAYSIFEYFLKRIKTATNGDGIPIPSVTSEVYDRGEGDPIRIAETFLGVINERNQLVHGSDALYDRLQKEVLPLERRGDRIEKTQSVIEKFVVSSAFEYNITSRRAYDFIRSRTTFLELTNYGTFEFAGCPAEVVYLISDFEPVFGGGSEPVEYSEGRVYINQPKFEELKERLKFSISKVYSALKKEFGYVKVSEMRERVCRELRVSDNLFDDYVKRLYQLEPHWLSFTYSGAADKVTEKRLPIVFESPTRQFFTLLKVNPGRE